MTLSENRIYLASRSPRRRELLKQIGVNFGILLLREAAPRADMAEIVLSGEAPADYTTRIAVVKAEMGRARLLERRLTELPVLAADTAVVLGERIFGKPENVAHAKEMLRALSGQTHQVLTAVAVAAQNGIQVSMSRSVVRFRDISEHEIQCYLSVGEALDKAGVMQFKGWLQFLSRKFPAATVV